MPKEDEMESNSQRPETIAETFVRAINRHDVDELVSLMSPGHCLIDGLGNRTVGLAKLRAA